MEKEMAMHTKSQNQFSAHDIYIQNGSLRDVLNVLFRRKRTFSLFFLVIVLATAFHTFFTPETFKSEAKLLIRVGRESLAIDPTVEGPTVSLSQSHENEVNSELAIIKSRLLAERVIDKITPEVFLAGGVGANSNAMGESSVVKMLKETWNNSIALLFQQDPEEAMSTREAAINTLMDSLTVEVEQKSNVIGLGLEASSPQFAQEMLNTFLGFYQEHHIQVYSTHASPQFFEDQAAKLLGELQEKEKSLEEFRAANNISAISIQKEKLFDQISRLEGQVAEINSQISASTAHNISLEKGLQGRSKNVELGRTAGLRSESTDKIKERLFDFRVKEADLSARYPDNHRELVEVREQIKLAVAALGNDKQIDEVTMGIDPNYQALQLALATGRAQLQAQIASKRTLMEDLSQPKAELAMLVKNEVAEARLTRDARLLEDAYLQYRHDMQRTNISKALDMDKVSNLSIIQPASIALEPIKPNKPLNLSLGLLIGFFGGITLAFIAEYHDDSLKTKEEVEKKLGLPVLASVPCEESRLCI